MNQKVGKNGRKKQGTKSSSSLETQWKNLQIVYKVAMKKKFEPHVYEEIQEVGLLRLGALESHADLSRFYNTYMCYTNFVPQGEGIGSSQSRHSRTILRRR